MNIADPILKDLKILQEKHHFKVDAVPKRDNIDLKDIPKYMKVLSSFTMSNLAHEQLLLKQLTSS